MILGVALGHKEYHLGYSERGLLVALLVVPLVMAVNFAVSVTR